MKNSITIALLVVIIINLCSCGGEILPKPKAMLRLSYPPSEYAKLELDCPYTFEKNNISDIQVPLKGKKCWYNIEYSSLKATIYISYYAINNNLESLLRDAQNLTQEHVVKADAIQPKDFVYPEKRIFGRMYEVSGNAASPYQFYLTDSTRHFVSGSVYFKIKPNYDSILPAANYLRNDIMHIMETIQWKE
ncbi:gliding motility lipoprotein GldD [Aquimarina sp. MMG016]|uniref:gliding motility lipoprotein GldD n=1 Tax=Aquimarina sp. MMG016 TaxID=2822690 RepID=UPI001B3A5B8B|nr:gliding motility lipoprotein GldD [Aquimarina sp. MMG016]MBQ4819799.1 gliding motility lipoprotein GldD [Aquimarina sp. MMG016]